jgi:hypothetical protein
MKLSLRINYELLTQNMDLQFLDYLTVLFQEYRILNEHCLLLNYIFFISFFYNSDAIISEHDVLSYNAVRFHSNNVSAFQIS